MFILPCATLPLSPPELADEISAGYRLFFEGRAPVVAVEGEGEGVLSRVSADLTGAVMEKRPSFGVASLGGATPALTTRELFIFGEPLTLFGARISVTLQAEDVVLHQAAVGQSQIMLFPGSARSGRLTIETQRTDLEVLLKRVIVRQAGKQGVTVENVALSLEATSPRSLRAVIAVAVRKLFIQTTLRLSGELTIDESLAARLHHLHCEGEGNFGTLGCAMLAPHLARLEARSFPLSKLPLGSIALRNLALEVAGERTALRADFT